MFIDITELWVVLPTARNYNPDLDTKIFTDYDIAVSYAFDKWEMAVKEQKETSVINEINHYKVISLDDAINEYADAIHQLNCDDSYREGFSAGEMRSNEFSYEEGFRDGQTSVYR